MTLLICYTLFLRRATEFSALCRRLGNDGRHVWPSIVVDDCFVSGECPVVGNKWEAESSLQEF